MRTTLYHLASCYGEVIDINVCKYKNITKMRGQAFLTFRDLPMAQYAMKNLQGQSLFGKSIEV